MKPLSSMSMQQRYEVFAERSRELLNAAQSGDWDSVTTLGHSYASTVAAMNWLHKATPQNEEERQNCLKLLAVIIEQDKETDKLAREQLQEIRGHMSSTRKSRWLLNSYGSFPPIQKQAPANPSV